MSKIYQAYKKQGAELPDIAERLKRVGSMQLYPPPHESQQEEFAKLCLRLLSIKEDHRGSVIAVASSASGEGSSFISFSLATVMGLVYDQNVAWIDGNFRSPQKKLMGHQGVTFADVLRDPGRVDELSSGSSRVTLVPGGADLQVARALFTDSNYTDLLLALSSRFDFTIIDLPPILETQDTALMAKRTDGVLLVVAHRQLKYEPIRSGVLSLQEVGVNLLGAVMNRRQFDLPGFLHKWI